VLDILVQRHRDRKAAQKFFRKLLKGLRYVPNVIITAKLRSYSVAKAEVLPSWEFKAESAEAILLIRCQEAFGDEHSLCRQA
jgi:transposase-like protein